MILRLWHWLYGHKWETISAVYLKGEPTGAIHLGAGNMPDMGDFFESLGRHLHGFTEVQERCSCGRGRTIHMTGDHSGIKAHPEVAILENMFKEKGD